MSSSRLLSLLLLSLHLLLVVSQPSSSSTSTSASNSAPTTTASSNNTTPSDATSSIPSPSSTGTSIPFVLNNTNPPSQALGVQNVPFRSICSSAPWPARYLHSAVSSAKTIVLLGGLLGPGQEAADTWRSQDGGVTWSLLSNNSAWGPLHSATAMLVNDAMLLVGGVKNAQPRNDVWSTGDLGVTWTPLPRGSFSPRYGHSTAVDITTNTVLLLGGMNTSPLNDIYLSMDSGVSWQAAPTAPFVPRYYATSFWRGSTVFVYGGITTRAYAAAYDASLVAVGDFVTLKDCWKSNDNGYNWVSVAAASEFPYLGPRALLSTMSFADTIYAFAGADSLDVVGPQAAASVKGDVWSSVDAGESWQLQGWVAAYGPRAAHATVLVGQSVILMGGVNKGYVYNDVWRSDLPSHESASSGGAVVAGILGAFTGILVIVLILRQCAIKLQGARALEQLQKHHRIQSQTDEQEANNKL